MTPADHAALSAQLARAIGYYPESVRTNAKKHTCADDDGVVYSYVGGCDVYNGRGPDGVFAGISEGDDWYEFDYRDPSVALPVLEWLMREHDCYPLGPEKDEDGNTVRKGYEVWQRLMHGSRLLGKANTLHEAIAQAAIAVGGGE